MNNNLNFTKERKWLQQADELTAKAHDSLKEKLEPIVVKYEESGDFQAIFDLLPLIPDAVLSAIYADRARCLRGDYNSDAAREDFLRIE